MDVDRIVSVDLVIEGGKTLSFSLSNVSDRVIDLLTGIFSVDGGIGLSSFLSNVSDRVKGLERFSVLIEM
jgi:hypothetical protein